MKSLQRSVLLPYEVDLRATLRRSKTAPGGSGTRRHGQQVWRAVRTPEGPSTTHIVVRGGDVTAEAWGPGAGWALDTLPQLLGADDTPETFVAHHRLLSELHRRHRGLRIGRTGLVFEALPRSILAQKVTGVEASRSWRRLVSTYGEPAPGPGALKLGPPPELLAALAYEDFHPLGVERKRAEVVIRVARHAKRMEEAAAMPIDDAYRRLMAVRGIGIWTASLVLGEALGDPDAVPVGDYHVPNTVTWALAREPRGTDERMLELLEPYRGHRHRVVRLLHLGGIGAPKYGPRNALRDITRI